jgi:hypothetical protein
LGSDFPASLDSAAVGQAHIHDHEIGLKAIGHGDRLFDAACLGHDLELLAPLQQGNKALADHLMVVDDQQSKRPRG